MTFSAVLVEPLAVLELPEGVLLERLELAGDVVGLDRVAQGLELRDRLAHAVDHHIRGEVTVELVDGVELGTAVPDALEHAPGGGQEGRGPAVADLHELDLAAGEGAVDGLALFAQGDHELVEVGEAAFERLDLGHELAEVAVGLLGRVADVQVVGHALVDELHLRGELGPAFDAGQLAHLVLQRASHLVDAAVDQADGVDDGGGGGGVGDLEVRDDLDEHFQLAGGRGDLPLQLARLRDLLERGDRLVLPRDGLPVGGQGLGLEQELHAQAGELVRVLGDGLLHPLCCGGVHVAQLAEGDDLPARCAAPPAAGRTR